LETAGFAHGLAVAREIYADRAYTDAGLLVERSCPGAMLHDAGDAAARVLTMVLEGAIITISGKRLAAGIDSICVHGDSPNAVAMAKAVRACLEQAGIALAPFAAV
jgi:5-oxoprolinase (ATP-hydrolysing) subunit A